MTCDDGQACSTNDICSPDSVTARLTTATTACRHGRSVRRAGWMQLWNQGRRVPDRRRLLEALDLASEPCQDCNRPFHNFSGLPSTGSPATTAFPAPATTSAWTVNASGSLRCNDGLACTSDSCNGDGTCTFSRLGGWCLIDNTCIRDQTLEPGNICRACLSALEGFDWSDNNDVPCDDGLACTKIDTCMAGSCGGTAYACNDGLDCTTDACDGQGSASSPLETSCLLTVAASPTDHRTRTASARNVTFRFQSFLGFRTTASSATTSIRARSTTCARKVGVSQEYNCLDSVECTLDLCDGSGGCSLAWRRTLADRRNLLLAG